MKTNLLSSDKDPMGTAIADYFNHNKADKLRVFSSQFEEDEIPVNQLFRPYDEMPELEQIALQIAEGNILDVGAGSGCHALALQEMGKEVCAIDISPRSVEVMEKRGVRNVRQMNLFDPHFLQVQRVFRTAGGRDLRDRSGLACVFRYPDPRIVEVVHKTLAHIETRDERQGKKRDAQAYHDEQNAFFLFRLHAFHNISGRLDESKSIQCRNAGYGLWATEKNPVMGDG